MIEKSLLEKFELPDADDFIVKCQKFYDLLVEANKVMNLTRIDSEEGFAIKHVVDSLHIMNYFPFLRTEAVRIADVGCGAGFPSIILAMAFPNLRIAAIDSVGKKVAFVSNAINALGLGNIVAIHGRSREMGYRDEYKGKFQIVTARAVGGASAIYLDAVKMLSTGGKFILYKTPGQAAEEQLELSKLKPKHHWKITETFSLDEDNSGERCFLYF